MFQCDTVQPSLSASSFTAMAPNGGHTRRFADPQGWRGFWHLQKP